MKSKSNKIKLCFFILCLLCVLFMNLYAEDNTNRSAESQPWSVRMAESIMIRHPNGYGNWDYVTGTVLRGFEELWRYTGDSRYFEYIKKTVNNVVSSNGVISDYRVSDYNIDEINEGRMLLLLYKETGDSRYQTAAAQLRLQLSQHPRTSEGGFWHKQRYPHQMWLDGLYMGSPFYAEYCRLFNEPDNLADVVKQLTLMEKHARDYTSGLLYHGWDESKEQSWANPITGCSPSFWGRALGWYAMATVDVLDFLPLDHPGRDSVVAIVQRLAVAVVNVQDEATGAWWQVLDQGGRVGNYIESSATCMFVYFLAKSIRLGYIDASYWPIVMKGYQGILDEFISENANGTINLDQTCVTAGLGYGRDGTYNYYVNETHITSNDGKALSPFITASIEIERYKKQTDVKIPIITNAEIEFGNYPNPFNAGTIIRYSLPAAGHVSLSIYDILGRQINVLVDEKQFAGTHTITFQLGGNSRSELASGVYYAVLQTSSYKKNIKIVYLK